MGSTGSIEGPLYPSQSPTTALANGERPVSLCSMEATTHEVPGHTNNPNDPNNSNNPNNPNNHGNPNNVNNHNNPNNPDNPNNPNRWRA